MQVQRRLNRKHLDLIDSINWNRHTFCHASDLPSHIQINSQIVQIKNHLFPIVLLHFEEFKSKQTT